MKKLGMNVTLVALLAGAAGFSTPSQAEPVGSPSYSRQADSSSGSAGAC